MKYIFTIHSHITFLSALSVIEYESLDKASVILICSKYSAPLKENSEIRLIKSFDEVERNYNIFQKVKNLNYGKGCDNYINLITGGDNYIAFIDLMSVFNRFLVTNIKCLQFNFIEEGSINYGDFDNFRMLTIDLDKYNWRLNYRQNFKELLMSLYRILRGRSLRILNLPINPNTYAFFEDVKFYGLNEFSHPNIPKNKKIVTSLKSIKKEFNLKKDYPENLNNGIIWIGDASCSFYKISMKHFEDSLEKLLKKMDTTETQRVFIKYQGSQSNEEKEITEKVFTKNNFSVSILPSDTVIEDIMLKFKNLKVFGSVSSLLIYAKVLGHKVDSIFTYIPDIYNIPFATNFKTIHQLLNITINEKENDRN